MPLEGSVKEKIGQLIYEAIDTLRRKKHKIPSDFSICNYLNTKTDKDEDLIEERMRYLLENAKLENEPKNEVYSNFKGNAHFIFLCNP